MSDCGSTVCRELLPDYLHQRLTVAERTRVDAHLAECEECRLELAMLTTFRDARREQTPVIDTAAIVRALPKPPRRRAARPWVLRLAAAISFVSIGGVSLVVARSFYDGGDVTAIADSSRSGASSDSGARSDPAASDRGGLTVAGGLGDLGVEEIEQLMGTLESLEGVPSADPDDLLAQEIPRAGGVR